MSFAVDLPFRPGANRTVGGRRLPADAWAWAATGVLALSMLTAVFGPVLHGRPTAPEDDAQYYRVIAEHIARTGVSTFDGQSLTNGYHPLWEGVLVLQDLLVGPSLLITRLIEVVLIVAAFPLFLRAVGLRSALGVVAFLAAYGRLVARLSLTGMEVSALVAGAALTMAAAMPTRRDGPRRGVLLGLAAAAAILARIDAAVFVLPLVVLAPLRRTTRLCALAVAGTIGMAYLAFNLAVFGVALPVSSSVKSLGGLQLNHRFVDQMVAAWRTQGPRSLEVQIFACLALCPLALWTARARPFARALTASALIGGVLFYAKLTFASSWRIWPWYDFPIVFLLPALVATCGPPVEEAVAALSRTQPRWGRQAAQAATVAAALILGALAAKAARVLEHPPEQPRTDFDALNRRAAARWAPLLNGQRVAMGDRAGSFAAAYPGSVVQLEGLVNDRAYLSALKAGGDITPLLCRRGVRFLLAYRPELGDYRVHRMPMMRPALTQSAGAYVDLDRSDEAARLRDRSVLDLRGIDEADDTLVLWRLGRCAQARAG